LVTQRNRTIFGAATTGTPTTVLKAELNGGVECAAINPRLTTRDNSPQNQLSRSIGHRDILPKPRSVKYRPAITLLCLPLSLHQSHIINQSSLINRQSHINR
jgi:hypothetical protein